MTSLPNRALCVDRLELLRFYDDPSEAEKGMAATAVNAMAGEELGLSLLLRYFESVGVAAEHLVDETCTQRRKGGYRLDAWIKTPDVAYQVEVKNWSAHSFGGTRLPPDASEEVARRHRVKLWGQYWDSERSTFVDKSAAKVLRPMVPPEKFAVIEPLIVFWAPVHPTGAAEPFFAQPLKGSRFPVVWVFSMSTYLRGLESERLELALPKTAARLAILDRLFCR